MKLLKLVPISIILFLSLFLSGCNEETTVTPVIEDDQYFDLAKFTLPESAVLESATFNIYVNTPRNKQINLHNVNVQWEESETWNTFLSKPAPRYSSSISGSFTPTSVDWYSVNVTTLVQGWIDGSIVNNGLLLDQPDATSEILRTRYDSKENASGRAPYLEIVYSLDGISYTVTESAYSDTYLFETDPDNPNGGSQYLYNGKSSGAIKQTLIKFDIEETPAGGGNNCTRLPFYWMKHSTYGPLQYDATWAQIGEDTPFFSSGRSYYQVLWTLPLNPYYTLGRVYVAAKLNFLNGADPAAVQSEFEEATTLFNTYTPLQVKTMGYNNPIRKKFINLAIKLAKYNIGLLGPGHCGC